ncbi:uncharacterized protein FFB20_05281 [Fusarium fujikuroi]|nr:uncharacterized protein FFB20_05281 [Fusarium fujikuroi]SCN81716.1 uncharacterized protein FFE2_04726 [Fusarium fujikuroi]SCN84218.1 uncharacterized protein FFM5_03271 [Fusarium fujikuroi]SCN85417.1 uncharacterized protein FFC1_04865 [Fusarium fujikuroi]SCO34091.1 uncharacterized protein FFNC_03626 [Fusarium fujikuroi]
MTAHAFTLNAFCICAACVLSTLEHIHAAERTL